MRSGRSSRSCVVRHRLRPASMPVTCHSLPAPERALVACSSSTIPIRLRKGKSPTTTFGQFAALFLYRSAAANTCTPCLLRVRQRRKLFRCQRLSPYLPSRVVPRIWSHKSTGHTPRGFSPATLITLTLTTPEWPHVSCALSAAQREGLVLITSCSDRTPSKSATSPRATY